MFGVLRVKICNDPPGSLTSRSTDKSIPLTFWNKCQTGVFSIKNSHARNVQYKKTDIEGIFNINKQSKSDSKYK
jgi:hypothetical protein